MINKQIFSFIIISVFLILALGSGDDSDATQAKKSNQPYLDSMPKTQILFLDIIEKYDSIYGTSENEIQFQKICDNKSNEIRSFFKNTNPDSKKVENWYGKVEELESYALGGGLIVSSESKSGTTFKLTSDEDEAYIRKSSELYDKISNFKKGDIVKFTGKFVRSPYNNRYLWSITEYSNSKQEYLFKFESIEVIK